MLTIRHTAVSVHAQQRMHTQNGAHSAQEDKALQKEQYLKQTPKKLNPGVVEEDGTKVGR